MIRVRCPWAGDDPLYVRYHDEEWGVPLHDDARLFEFMVLEGAQAGLSWLTILRKREAYRAAFEGFDPARVAAFGPDRIHALREDRGIVRNKLKIESAVRTARIVLELQREFGSLDAYLWGMVGGGPFTHHFAAPGDIPARTLVSSVLSRDLTRRGVRFFGPVIAYAFMQAVGMVNDHLVGCFRHSEISRPAPTG
jgi:DNA-3-methyladenine glycosylase I